MLVLTRSVLTPKTPKETVVLRDKVTGQVLAVIGLMKVFGKKGRLAIQAGDEIEIMRGELIEGPEGEICLVKSEPTDPQDPTHPQPGGVLKVKGQRTAKKSA